MPCGCSQTSVTQQTGGAGGGPVSSVIGSSLDAFGIKAGKTCNRCLVFWLIFAAVVVVIIQGRSKQ